MGLLGKLFGPKPKPEQPAEPEQPTRLQPGAIVPNYGYPTAAANNLSPQSVEQTQQMALQLAQMAALYDQQAAATEAMIEQAQRLYGRQVQHQSKLQSLHSARFPIELMAAGLVHPAFGQSAPAPAQPKASKMKSKARRALGD